MLVVALVVGGGIAVAATASEAGASSDFHPGLARHEPRVRNREGPSARPLVAFRPGSPAPDRLGPHGERDTRPLREHRGHGQLQRQRHVRSDLRAHPPRGPPRLHAGARRGRRRAGSQECPITSLAGAPSHCATHVAPPTLSTRRTANRRWTGRGAISNRRRSAQPGDLRQMGSGVAPISGGRHPRSGGAPR